jgi:hypothetical protein
MMAAAQFRTTLSVWRSECPVCGEPFEARTPKRARNFEPKRRIVRGTRLGAAS